jgi:hypothetical protein
LSHSASRGGRAFSEIAVDAISIKRNMAAHEHGPRRIARHLHYLRHYQLASAGRPFIALKKKRIANDPATGRRSLRA